MIALCRIAILGLYNSRSPAFTGALHWLGVHMGAPFWYSSDDRAKNNFYIRLFGAKTLQSRGAALSFN